ncbi:guanine nucleotide-binding protein-like 3 homolog [Episyrphus balteatus]|uniref:guanine nucleotide-binding protein-like 3 homolog n=1 Tax=Episyrphus balteatus TaxID=286459 RepID=UPI002486A196|nr:guanine nucleotide-binding protein-like 3 homolog [Episyrphus balteatus]
MDMIQIINSIFLLFLGSLCSLGLTYQVNEKESLPPKLSLRPGDLLRSLDALTSDAQVIYSPLQETPLKQAERRVYHDDELLSDSQQAGSDYDYDKAYENFVNKYFAKGEEELDDDHEDDDEDEKAEGIDDVAPFEYSSETDNEPKEEKKSKKSSGSKKCERVKIDNQNCKVCEDLETNEKSKTCSYSSDSKPKSYAYSKERSTKHSSDDDENDDEDDDVKSSETGKSVKREISPNNKKKYQLRRTSIESFLKPIKVNDDTPKCSRQLEDGMICFYCGSASENTRECIVDKNNLKKRRLDESSKKDSETKKIFKRMVTYSYNNKAEPNFKENTYSAIKRY